MKIAIVHYHLGAGGVTQVITTASREMTRCGISHVILTGPSADPAPGDLPLRTVDGLGYSGEVEVAAIRTAARDALGAVPDVWHFHNHSLGKSSSFTRLVESLAAAGERLLLHIHDLAEDGRPENASNLLACTMPYPLANHVHYAFLNSRDRSRFIAAGAPEAQAHLLLNSTAVEPAAVSKQNFPLVLYPVRGIRRKNLGEILLLAAHAPLGTRFAITRAPHDPQALRIHAGWRRFAAENKLPVAFDVVDHESPAEGAGPDFQDWLDHATHLISTSISEGFGLAFLESIALGKPMLGRALKHLNDDLATQSVHFENLYDSICVPADWLDQAALNTCRAVTMRQTWNAWGRELPPASLATARGMATDFGNLPEFLQQRVIHTALIPGNRNTLSVTTATGLQPLSDWLKHALVSTALKKSLAPWSPQAHWQRLESIYGELMHAVPNSPIALDPARMLDSCLTAENFHFLTSPEPPRPAADFSQFRAVIFDVYGTLLDAPSGGVKQDPATDPMLRDIITRFGFVPPESPSSALHAAVRREHEFSGKAFPEVDLRALWRSVLQLTPNHDISALVLEIEAAWHPSELFQGVTQMLEKLSASGVPLGILSNAQCNTLPSLGSLADLFSPDLNLLSFQHGIAKPSPALFELLAARLALHGIMPHETLYIGNDPLHDIEPAALFGFKTALYTGHSSSWRAGACFPDYEIGGWTQRPDEPACGILPHFVSVDLV